MTLALEDIRMRACLKPCANVVDDADANDLTVRWSQPRAAVLTLLSVTTVLSPAATRASLGAAHLGLVKPMLFWSGLVVALVGGLLLIGLSLQAVKLRFPVVGDYYLDVAAVLAFVGLVLVAVEHYRSERSFRELSEKTSPRHLTTAQRRAMAPLLTKLKGRPIAFAFRMMDGESLRLHRRTGPILSRIWVPGARTREDVGE